FDRTLTLAPAIPMANVATNPRIRIRKADGIAEIRYEAPNGTERTRVATAMMTAMSPGMVIIAKGKLRHGTGSTRNISSWPWVTKRSMELPNEFRLAPRALMVTRPITTKV